MKKQIKPPVLIVGAALLVAAVVTTVAIVRTRAPKPDAGNGVVGVVVDNWDPGIPEETPKERKGVRIPGYAAAQMKAGDRSLRISIGNPKENEVGFYATLKLDDGTVLYESDLLLPGQGLLEVPLKQTLEQGEYAARVVFSCVTLDESHTPLNSAESGFTLTVT